MTPSRLKIDLFMPLEIGRYLQDTAHLDIEKSGAYLHLLMHYWTRGPLPNDMNQLASIARMSTDAWSIAYAVLKQFFSIGQDGRLHQAGADRRLEFWSGKKQKAHDKAQKAARARWDKEKAKRQAKTDAPSIAHALLEQCPIEISVETKAKADLTPTPSAAQMGTDRPIPAAASSTGRPGGPSPRQAGTSPRQLGASPRQTGQAPKQLGTSPRQLGTSPRQNGTSPRQVAAIKSEGKEKHLKNGSGGPQAGLVRGYQHNNGNGGVAVAPKRIAPGVKNAVRPTEASVLEKEVFSFWEGGEVEGFRCPWTYREDRALEALLKSHPDLDLQHFKLLLQNRSLSEGVVRSDPPHKWLRSLVKYADGPLDRFGKPLASRRTM